jgi:holin-like protein
MLGAITALLLFQCLGEGISFGLDLPVPGPVVGMILLFVFLLLRPKTIAVVEPSADLLLKHLSLLFVPAGVGVMAFGQQVHGEWLAIIVALFVSTLLAIAVTAWVTQKLMRGHSPAAHAGSDPLNSDATTPAATPASDSRPDYTPLALSTEKKR